MLYGYARVSTIEQETALQLDALKRTGCTVIHQEKTSSVGARPELQRLLAKIGPADLLVVYKLDRIARSLKDLLNILERLDRIGCGIRSLTEPIDTSTPAGRLMLQILGAVAEFERSLIRERAIAGQVAAYRRGKRWGGQPQALQPEDADEVYRLRKIGFTIPMLADIFGCSESTIWRVIWARSRPQAKQTLPVLRRYLDG